MIVDGVSLSMQHTVDFIFLQLVTYTGMAKLHEMNLCCVSPSLVLAAYLKRFQPPYITSAICEQPTLSVMVWLGSLQNVE